MQSLFQKIEEEGTIQNNFPHRYRNKSPQQSNNKSNAATYKKNNTP